MAVQGNTQKIFPSSHKTVVILDHSPFMSEPCGQTVDFDILPKSRAAPGIIPLAPLAKSLWTCTVEAASEYARVVYDVYPPRSRDKLLKFVITDTEARSLNSWMEEEQSLSNVLQGLAVVGPPSDSDDAENCSVMHGLAMAVESLCEGSEKQLELRASLADPEEPVVNKGRVVCITTVKSQGHIQMLEECMQEAIVQHNKIAEAADKLPITHCELVLIHTVPVGADNNIQDQPNKEVSSLLSCEVHSVHSGRHIAAKLALLVQKHFHLTSTTITGIPMKEEQNASTSANYDVEILHSKDAHIEILKMGSTSQGYDSSGFACSKDSFGRETVILKWCTPKTNIVELQYCTGAYRITPADVNSRPSSCLTNFLLNGRAVMLEQPRKSGSKVISHMLASHGGEIFLHCLGTGRSPLEDPPSISEGAGGRVTDYRITDYGDFMKENRLMPYPVPQEGHILPKKEATAVLERTTRYWPLVISDTIIFNMASHIDPLPTLITKAALTEDDVLECQKSIYHLVGMESRSEPLPIPAMGTRGKGPKRDEQYRQMWAELDTLLRAHASTSINHQKVLECLQEIRRPAEEAKESSRKAGKKEEVVVKEERVMTEQSTAELAWQEIQRYKAMSERERSDFERGNTNNDHFRHRQQTEVSSPPIKKLKTSLEDSQGKQQGGPPSLLAIWTSRIKSKYASRHCEFAGRLTAEGNKAELYVNLQKDSTNGTSDKPSGVKQEKRGP
ncbi:integrator complex subunit 13-like isoform X1 [Branchiostoma floridae x Branchiostoma belcheri]